MYKPIEIVSYEVIGHEWVAKGARKFRQNRPVDSTTGELGESDSNLLHRLSVAGDEHAKPLRGFIVYFELHFQLGWGIEFMTYSVGMDDLGTSSTMHRLVSAGLRDEALAIEKQARISDVVYERICVTNYQTLRRIYFQRRKHAHPDWKIFCRWIESLPHFAELIGAQKPTKN